MAVRFIGNDFDGIDADANGDLWVLTQAAVLSNASDAFDFLTFSNVELVVEGSIYSPADAIDSDVGSAANSVFVGVEGLVYASSDGIEMSGDNHEVHVHGEVHGLTDRGVQIIGNLGKVYNSGAIFGQTDGISLEGNNHRLENIGTINSEFDGVNISGTGNFVFNAGNIFGLRDGLDFQTITGDVNTLRNTGTIGSNGVTGFSVTGDFGDEMITNLGDLLGDVDLGGGDDFFDTRGGVVVGTVFGDAGQDVFRGNADEAETFNGGADADTLDFRFGAAVTVALDGSFDNAGAALGDIYQAFERVNGSAESDVIRGNGTGNTLTGGSGDDTIDGAAGADVIRGGTGVDLVTGGLGNDFFRFNSASEFGDVITDFLNVGGNNDRFQIAASVGGGLAAGLLAASQFQSRADNQAQDADDRFIFRTTDRTLWFDADGNGAGAAVLVADLQAGATMTAADILVF